MEFFQRWPFEQQPADKLSIDSRRRELQNQRIILFQRGFEFVGDGRALIDNPPSVSDEDGQLSRRFVTRLKQTQLVAVVPQKLGQQPGVGGIPLGSAVAHRFAVVGQLRGIDGKDVDVVVHQESGDKGPFGLLDADVKDGLWILVAEHGHPIVDGLGRLFEVARQFVPLGIDQMKGMFSIGPIDSDRDEVFGGPGTQGRCGWCLRSHESVQ